MIIVLSSLFNFDSRRYCVHMCVEKLHGQLLLDTKYIICNVYKVYINTVLTIMTIHHNILSYLIICLI